MLTGSAPDLRAGLVIFPALLGNIVSHVRTRCACLGVLTGSCFIVLLVSSLGWAHAVPRTTLPESNAVLDEAPQQVAIRFSERVEARASSLQVFDVHGLAHR